MTITAEFRRFIVYWLVMFFKAGMITGGEFVDGLRYFLSFSIGDLVPLD